MRCKNCGWPNKPNETTCVKCHAPLDAGDNNSFAGNAPLGNNNDDGRCRIIYDNPPLNKTVMEGDVFGGVAGKDMNRMEPQESSSNLCPKCGYPVRQGADKCPNCKFQLNQSTIDRSNHFIEKTRQDEPRELNVRPTRMSGEAGNKPQMRGTVNPYMMNLELEPVFTLKPVKRMNERHELEEQEYEGKETVLNRENTEPGNASITSRQQAIVSHSDGHWYIEDRSEQKTTFVQAASKIELHDGDLVLLGNRLFEFHT